MANAVLARRSERAAERTDHQLVSAVRRGDDRAFEELYSRYQRRIAAYVYGMVRDHGRAEDITQEVFVAALRRVRETERPIAFKPWVYEIAKNACIDAYRRTRRAEEVSFDADDRLSPADHVRLVATGPEPDAAVDVKQELENLCGAFGGLSQSHHEILVLRELEGLSYKDIGDRMGMSRPAVESTLFRARKRLGEEYEELASGARCLRVQAIVEAGSRLSVRERRNLARHVSHCQPCRQLAVRAGLDVPAPARRRLAEKLAGLLPLPAVLRWRRGGGEEATTAFGGGGGTWMTHVPLLTDSMSSGWNKAAAGLAALALAGAGVGATTMTVSEKRDERGTGYRATDVRTESNGGNAAPTPPRRAAVPAADGPAKAARRDGRSTSTTASSSDRRGAAKARPGDGGQAGSGDQQAAGGGAPAASGGSDSNATGGGTGASGGGGDPAPTRSPGGSAPTRSIPGTEAPKLPSVEAPTAPAPSVGETTRPVTEAVPDPAQVVPAPPAVPELPVTVPDPGQVVPAPPAPVDDPVGGVDLP